jgi:hypothetical protein
LSHFVRRRARRRAVLGEIVVDELDLENFGACGGAAHSCSTAPGRTLRLRADALRLGAERPVVPLLGVLMFFAPLMMLMLPIS